MGQSKRRTEKWFNRLLWIIAVLFAAFLIGLGGKVIQDLPLMSKTLVYESFRDQDAYDKNNEAIENLYVTSEEIYNQYRQYADQLSIEQAAYDSEKESFENWLKTRTATLDPSQDAELIARTARLEKLREVLSVTDKLRLEAQQKRNAINSEIAVIQNKNSEIDAIAGGYYYKAIQKQNTQEFLIRLLITLPLIVIAIWLFVKRRKGPYWPFTWGFIFFALFAFFFELVPYLPSYGGYVRFSVGILLTVAGGYYAIRGFQKYREKQRVEENATETERRKMLSYNFVLQRLDKSLCPSCERGINYRDPSIDFCPHCGINLVKRCPTCNMKKNAFLNYCPTCGTKEQNQVVDE